MSHYQYDVSISRQKRFIRRFKKLLWFLLCILILVGAVVAFDALRQTTEDNTETGAPSTTTIRPSIREFDSEYFTFTAPPSWTNVASESTAQKFVYRSLRGQLVEQELTVYVNEQSADLSATRVLPVRIEEGKRLIPSEVSDHCNTASALKKANAPMPVTIGQVSMLCRLDDTNYLVVIGEKGGNTDIKLTGASKTTTFHFMYRNSTFTPDTTQLIDILNSFTPI